MAWVAIAAIASMLSVAVIAISATFALRQVNQLRRAAQLDGTLRIFAQFSDPDFIHARNFVFSELPRKLEDPRFVEELRHYSNVDLGRHPEYRVMLFLQLVGSLVKNRLVDGPGVFEFAQYTIVHSWDVLERVVRIQREAAANPYMWGGADYLAESAKRWLAEDARRRNVLNPATGEPWNPDQLR